MKNFYKKKNRNRGTGTWLRWLAIGDRGHLWEGRGGGGGGWVADSGRWGVEVWLMSFG